MSEPPYCEGAMPLSISVLARRAQLRCVGVIDPGSADRGEQDEHSEHGHKILVDSHGMLLGGRLVTW